VRVERDGRSAAEPSELTTVVRAAADGRFPPVDGGWTRVRPWHPGLEAVVAFTGHAFLAVEGPLPDLPIEGFGGAHDPRLVTALAEPDGWIDSLDALLVGRGRGAPGVLVPRPDLAGHPRAAHARRKRSDLRILGRATGSDVAVLARGVAGLTELSMELEPAHRGRGAGRALVADALRSVPAGEVVVASVAPGNAASLRAVLAAGFAPVGSLQVFRRAGRSPAAGQDPAPSDAGACRP
jgi:GNAT superfamily N-acetyltransferase